MYPSMRLIHHVKLESRREETASVPYHMYERNTIAVSTSRICRYGSATVREEHCRCTYDTITINFEFELTKNIMKNEDEDPRLTPSQRARKPELAGACRILPQYEIMIIKRASPYRYSSTSATCYSSTSIRVAWNDCSGALVRVECSHFTYTFILHHFTARALQYRGQSSHPVLYVLN